MTTVDLDDVQPKKKTPMDKVARYKWEMLDRPGEMRMIDKDSLHVDPDYQRDESLEKIRSIASEWSWIACGIIIVSLRKDGFYYTVDGNHRVVAARSRADIRELPCIVFRAKEVADEAKAFLRVNTNRKPVSVFDKFKALLLTRDPSAVLINKLIGENGLSLVRDSSSPRTVACIGCLLRHANNDQSTLIRVWPLLVVLAQEGSMHERMVDAVIYIESRISAKGESLLNSPWKDRLLRLGRQGIVEACAKASSYYSRGGSKIWAVGVVEALNKGTRNRLVIDQSPGTGD